MCNNTPFIRFISALAIIAFVCSFALISLPVVSQAVGNTYYIDSVSGNDSNNGTSSSTPWKTLTKVNATTFQPGDKILFKAGCSWTGVLYPKGSGNSTSYIYIDKYGTGSKPIINGNGKVFSSSDPIDAAVYFATQDYWSIKNLEVTNNSASVGDRQGIHIDPAYGSHGNFIIQNCYIHDVASNANAADHARIAAICVWPRSYASSIHDILINQNIISAAGSTGIYVYGLKGKGNATNNKVTNNTLSDIGGDGILVSDSTSPLVEYNIVNGAHLDTDNRYCCGIWPFKCDSAVIQYNEVYNVATVYDGEGFDCDYNCHNTIMQYNYSHNNEGGFMRICTNYSADTSTYNEGSIIRYNISQNDQKGVFNFTGNTLNTLVYNNTIYVRSGLSTKIVNIQTNNNKWPINTTFKNNIFYNMGSGGYYQLNMTTNTVFNYNVFYGNHPSTEPTDANKLTSDPMLVSPGSGANGRNTVNGYMLQTGSPCIGTGVLISNNGGKDYWGNTVSSTAAPNRGAWNGR